MTRDHDAVTCPRLFKCGDGTVLQIFTEAQCTLADLLTACILQAQWPATAACRKICGCVLAQIAGTLVIEIAGYGYLPWDAKIRLTRSRSAAVSTPVSGGRSVVATAIFMP